MGANTDINSLPFSLENTELAFKAKSNKELKKAELLFEAFNYKWIVEKGPHWAAKLLSIHVPIKFLIKKTLFAQFCGGEDIKECTVAMNKLWDFNIGSILDYSVEGEDTESAFEETANEVIFTIQKAAQSNYIPFSVFKTTGIGRFALLEKVSANTPLTEIEKEEWISFKTRFERICKQASAFKVRLFIDAEESWIQPAIDNLVWEMMKKYNTEEAIIFNTIQLYRHDRLAFLRNVVQSADFKLGFKLVRGAYMEKERERALQMGYPSPIQPDKASCDHDFNAALSYCVENLDKVAICCGSHNEESAIFLAKLMQTKEIAPNNNNIYFAQLLGMSDHISYNLAASGYNVAKYVPYGPVQAVLPYLSRRAKENSSVKGQAGRELKLIRTELQRRKTKKAV